MTQSEFCNEADQLPLSLPFDRTIKMILQPSDHRWRIAHRKTPLNVTIGYVDAPDEDSAMERAIGKFKIDPRLTGKLIAEKTKTPAARKWSR